MFTAKSTAYLRASPSTQARSMGTLYAGDEVEALARVRGTPWLLIGRNGQGVGYVHESLLQPEEAAYSPAYQAQPAYTPATADCRIVEQVVTTRDYGTQTARLRACRTGGGDWSFTQL